MIDLNGKKYGRLTVLEIAPKSLWKNRRAHWIVQCDCGSHSFILNSDDLLRGRSRSCGCLQKDFPGAFKHGMSRTAEYRAWEGMIQRCTNPNNAAYEDYGGRGITVFPLWIHDFLAFYEYMGPKPYPEYSLDRIDVDGNYEPGNLRWATLYVQRRNRRIPERYL